MDEKNKSIMNQIIAELQNGIKTMISDEDSKNAALLALFDVSYHVNKSKPEGFNG